MVQTCLIPRPQQTLLKKIKIPFPNSGPTLKSKVSLAAATDKPTDMYGPTYPVEQKTRSNPTSLSKNETHLLLFIPARHALALAHAYTRNAITHTHTHTTRNSPTTASAARWSPPKTFRAAESAPRARSQPNRNLPDPRGVRDGVRRWLPGRPHNHPRRPSLPMTRRPSHDGQQKPTRSRVDTHGEKNHMTNRDEVYVYVYDLDCMNFPARRAL